MDPDGVRQGALRGFPPPPDEQVRPAYRAVLVYQHPDWPARGTISGWWTSPEGVEACRLRLPHEGAPRWTEFDPDRMELLVEGGT